MLGDSNGEEPLLPLLLEVGSSVQPRSPVRFIDWDKIQIQEGRSDE
uniref:Uncharacterized protein n=1 Tax=Arundo donax TaxID=35708 RepID=A0A0A8ZEH4_ARUDO